MISRRQIILALGASTLATPLASEAQSEKKPRRIGLLGFGRPGANRSLQRLQESLRRFGYEEGKDLIFEMRFADGNLDRLPALATELVRLKV